MSAYQSTTMTRPTAGTVVARAEAITAPELLSAAVATAFSGLGLFLLLIL